MAGEAPFAIAEFEAKRWADVERVSAVFILVGADRDVAREKVAAGAVAVEICAIVRRESGRHAGQHHLHVLYAEQGQVGGQDEHAGGVAAGSDVRGASEGQVEILLVALTIGERAVLAGQLEGRRIAADDEGAINGRHFVQYLECMM
jgi:hypothetical protein